MMPQEQPIQQQPQYPGIPWAGKDDVQFLLGMEDIPQIIRDRFWIWGSRLLVLTNLRWVDVNIILAHFNVDFYLAISDPTIPLDHKMIQWLNDLKVAVRTSLLRAVGGDERERRLINRYRVETEARTEYREQIGKEKGRFGR